MNKILLLIVSISLASISFPAFAREPEIRLYKMTRDGHSQKYMLFGKGDNPGCTRLIPIMSIK